MKQTLIKHTTRPHTLVDFHFWATVFWVCLVPPTILWWGSSVIWVSMMSIYAIIVSHMAALSASRAEESVKDE